MMPVMVHTEYDGGEDHNLTFKWSVVMNLGLFLAPPMDKFMATCGAASLSYLNTVKKAMSLLSIGLPGLALTLDTNTLEWFTLMTYLAPHQ
eukprot:15103783-Ditylum_brightwellii.AAC.1